MSESLARSEYQLLLDVGDLLELYPELSGNWELDKVRFMALWDANQDALNFNFVEDEDNEPDS